MTLSLFQALLHAALLLVSGANKFRRHLLARRNYFPILTPASAGGVAGSYLSHLADWRNNKLIALLGVLDILSESVLLPTSGVGLFYCCCKSVRDALAPRVWRRVCGTLAAGGSVFHFAQVRAALHLAASRNPFLRLLRSESSRPGAGFPTESINYSSFRIHDGAATVLGLTLVVMTRHLSTEASPNLNTTA